MNVMKFESSKKICVLWYIISFELKWVKNYSTTDNIHIESPDKITKNYKITQKLIKISTSKLKFLCP